LVTFDSYFLKGAQIVETDEVDEVVQIVKTKGVQESEDRIESGN
jgi:hypothetical protein